MRLSMANNGAGVSGLGRQLAIGWRLTYVESRPPPTRAPADVHRIGSRQTRQTAAESKTWGP